MIAFRVCICPKEKCNIVFVFEVESKCLRGMIYIACFKESPAMATFYR